MKPITDDVVHSLMQGIESREKTKRPVRKKTGPSAKIIKFAKGVSRTGDVVLLDAARPGKTISGVFCYVSRLRTPAH